MFEIEGVYRVYWNDTHVGDIRNPSWDDFPWAVGDFTPTNLTPQLGEVLEWFGNVAESDDDDLPEPPFPRELLDYWFIETPEGERKEISVPIVDKKNKTIMWR
jgi:hypothetical protein